MPESCLVPERRTGQKGANAPGPNLLDVESALQSMKVQFVNFGIRHINDDNVRREYIKQVERLSADVMNAVKQGKMTPVQGMQLAQEMRNEVMGLARLRTSDIGRAAAEKIKPTGRTLPELLEKYSRKNYGKSFYDLTRSQVDDIALEVIKSSGRDSPKATSAATNLGRLGKGLIIVTAAISIYNVATADDKGRAAAREAATLSGGFLGGSAAGFTAGWIGGPLAWITVPVSTIGGGILGALGAELVFDSYSD